MPELIDIVCPVIAIQDQMSPPSYSSPADGIASAETYVDTNSDFNVGEVELRICDSKTQSSQEELNLN